MGYAQTAQSHCQPIAMLLVVALLANAAAALKVTIAGNTVDLLHNPLLPHISSSSSGSGKAGAGSSPNLASALCPVTTMTHMQVSPFPIAADDVCGSFGLGLANNPYACVAFGQLGSILGNPPLRCAPDAIPTHPDVDPQGVPIPQPLPDRRENGQLPEKLNADVVLKSEGATLSWLHSFVQQIYLWAPCAEMGNRAAWQAPAGWQLLKMTHIRNGKNHAMQRMHSQELKAGSVPFMAVLKKDAASREGGSKAACQAWAKQAAAGTQTTAAADLCEGGMLVFVIRGTATPFEWTMDYEYKTRPDSNYGPGRFHEGFLRVADQLWDNGMREALDAALAAGDTQHIIITGHSLGGASTTLLSARAQVYLNNKAKAAKAGSASQAAPRLTAVMFGGANAGDAAFAAHFNKLVNARNVQYKYDIIYQVPCAPQITSCNQLEVPVPTAAGSTTGAWSYKRVGGQVDLGLKHIPVQREVWAKMSVLTQQSFCRNQESVLWNVDASHYCSYFCSLGAYAGQASWCKLWPESGAGSNSTSYCFEKVPGAAYPKAPSFPF